MLTTLSELSADVAIVAGTPAGIATAIAAARSGASVLLIEETGHLGGVVTGGLSHSDIRKKGAVGGLFQEFIRRVLAHYVAVDGPDSENVKITRQGHYFEPKVAEKIFREMMTGEERIRLLEKHRLVSAFVTGADATEKPARTGNRIDGAMPNTFGAPTTLTSIVVDDLANPGQRTRITAKVFVDATYDGDLAAAAGAPYRLGRESRDTFNEPHAGRIYLRFKDWWHLEGSTGVADDGIQSACFRFHITKQLGNILPIEKPDNYDRETYWAIREDFRAGRLKKMRDVLQLFPMPNGKVETNSEHGEQNPAPNDSTDLAEDNYGWPEASPEERARIFKHYWDHNEGFLWMLQHDEDVPPDFREEMLKWGFPKNEFEDNRGRPHHLYIREGRRIWGEYNFTERDAALDPLTGLPFHKEGSIAVCEFEFDVHSVSKYDGKHLGVREGCVFIPHEPLQLPYGMIVPKKVEGLLVPVALSASHVGYGTVRMEPIFMAIGEAAGIAATMAIRGNLSLREVPVHDLQKEILGRGGVILYETAPLIPEELR